MILSCAVGKPLVRMDKHGYRQLLQIANSTLRQSVLVMRIHARKIQWLFLILAVDDPIVCAEDDVFGGV